MIDLWTSWKVSSRIPAWSPCTVFSQVHCRCSCLPIIRKMVPQAPLAPLIRDLYSETFWPSARKSLLEPPLWLRVLKVIMMFVAINAFGNLGYCPCLTVPPSIDDTRRYLHFWRTTADTGTFFAHRTRYFHYYYLWLILFSFHVASLVVKNLRLSQLDITDEIAPRENRAVVENSVDYLKFVRTIAHDYYLI